MIIRSQDKKYITTDMNLEIVTNKYFPEVGDEDATIESKIHNSAGLLFGTYSTEEKAIKVLDMIQKEYLKHIYGAGGEMATRDIYISPFAFIPPKVFQMPQDSEV